VAAKARQVVASAAENALLKLQIEPYRSWNETLVKFKKLPPPRSKLYYSALKEEITDMGTTEWFYHNLQPQSKVKYIEYLIEYIKRTIQDKGGSGDITQTELDEYWTHMTVDVSGHNVLNSSVLGWSVILGEVFNNNFEKSAAPGMLPSIVSATPSGTSSDASDLSSNTRYTRGPVAPSGASSGAPSVASSAAASGAPSVAPPLNKHQLRKGVKSILVNSGNGMLEKMCHDMRIDYTECDTFIQEIYAYTDRMFVSGIKDVDQIAEGFVDEIQNRIPQESDDVSEMDLLLPDVTDSTDSTDNTGVIGNLFSGSWFNKMTFKKYREHKTQAKLYTEIETNAFVRLFDFDLKKFGEIIHDIINNKTNADGLNVSELPDTPEAVGMLIDSLYLLQPGSRAPMKQTLHWDEQNSSWSTASIPGRTTPKLVKKNSVEKFKLGLTQKNLIADFMTGFKLYLNYAEEDGRVPKLKNATALRKCLRKSIVDNISVIKELGWDKGHKFETIAATLKTITRDEVLDLSDKYWFIGKEVELFDLLHL
jgi:hypothetical protein